MKNETKILVGAIIVILLLLVGAFALSGSSPQPSATPTVSPVSVTPTVTPVPGGNTSTPTATATVTVTVTATPVPSVTPTPEPESGVKQTEFGYWITYPPLGPQNWSEFKPYPTEPAKNIVYFDPTSGTLSLNMEPASLDYYYDYIQTTVYREGDMSGTVNVTIHADTSEYIVNEPYLTDVDSSLYRVDYIFSMHDENYENLTGPDENGNYILTFGPGVSEIELCLHIESAGYKDAQVQEPIEGPGEMPEGQVTLTITGADGGFVPGAQDQYTLSLAYAYEVWFGTWDEPLSDGYIYAEQLARAQTTEGFGIGYGPDVDHIAENGSFVDVFIPIAREYDFGELTVSFNWEDDNGDFDAGDIIVAPFTFADGYNEGLVKVSIPKQYVLDYTANEVTVYIDYSSDYIVIYPNQFDIFINFN